MSTRRFSNVDGTNSPELGAWTIQETAANPGTGTRVFAPTPERTSTPASVRGWTVQTSDAGTLGGSDQNLTARNGVHH
jgi:hypothetical protein